MVGVEVMEAVEGVGDCWTEVMVVLEEVDLTAEWHELAATAVMAAASTTLGRSMVLRR